MHIAPRQSCHLAKLPTLTPLAIQVAEQPSSQQSKGVASVLGEISSEAEWVEHQDPATGRSFWCSSTTGESTWINPNSEEESEWEPHQDPASGSTYWYNEATGESTWTNPLDEAGLQQPVAGTQLGAYMQPEVSSCNG